MSHTIIVAPFTSEQVGHLAAYQRLGHMHPFTCGGLHEGPAPVLTATTDGWVCPAPRCGYTQVWAHDFMASPVRPDLRGVRALYVHVLLSTPRQSRAPI